MKTETYILPSHYASALINNDYSGLEDSDEKEIDIFINKHLKKGRRFYCVDADVENTYFSHGHDMNRNQGADVCKFTFDVSLL